MKQLVPKRLLRRSTFGFPEGLFHAGNLDLALCHLGSDLPRRDPGGFDRLAAVLLESHMVNHRFGHLVDESLQLHTNVRLGALMYDAVFTMESFISPLARAIESPPRKTTFCSRSASSTTFCARRFMRTRRF